MKETATVKMVQETKMTELNSICIKCKCLGSECIGTTNSVWTGCVYRKI